MSRRYPCLRIVLCLVLAAASGCTPQQPFYLGDDGDLSHYKGIATELEVPRVDVQPLDEVCGTGRPLSLDHTDAQMWDVTLEEAVRCALENSKVMRNLGASIAASDSLTRAADAVPTVYDPALQESNPRFGTEAALSAFDAQFTSSMFWEKLDRPLNVGGIGPLFMARVDQQDLGTFQSQLSKTNATGGTTGIGYNVYYDQSNSPTRQFPSDWNVDVTAEFRQPLFQGAGVQFNRIAGPGAIPGFNNGVIIARIENDIALADFEAAVRNMVLDTEKAYWSLYLAYRELDAVIAGRDAALETWRRTYNLQKQGARGGEAASVAQAREQYWLFVGQVEQRLSDVYANEAQLRYMMGLAVADGRQIRPEDEPTPAKVSFDWREAMCEALVRNVDLRRQKWRVKERELELIAAKNYVLPRLDAVGQYRWRGLGNDYWYADRTAAEFDTAMQNLTGGDFQDWQFGLEFSLPIGFRKQLAGVRFAQLSIAREKSLLREQELEVSHQLGSAIRDLELGARLINTNYQYYVAAKHEVAAVQAAYENSTITLNVLLEAQRRAAEAEIAYYRSLVEYNLAIVDVHYRKGSLLEYNGVWLAEGPWVGKAYFDAHRRAQARDAGWYIDYGFTHPKVISQGTYQQHACQNGQTPLFETMPGESVAPEQILAPIPEDATMPVSSGTNEGARSGQSTDVGPMLGSVDPPAPVPEAAPAGRDLAVKLAGYAAKTTAPSASAPVKSAAAESGQWKSVQRTSTSNQTTKTTSHESDSYSTSAQSADAASGWKRM
ncbi:MAG TPA: TolC family protein [Thermoguttaceae bacterium]|nr:TolC family protein [Thermoguttaceae bacterium]